MLAFDRRARFALVAAIALLAFEGCAPRVPMQSASPAFDAHAAPVAPSAPPSTSANVSPASSPNFEGCTASSILGRGWKYECSDVVSSIGDDDDVPPASLLEGAITGSQSSLPGRSIVRRTNPTIAGYPSKSAEIAARDESGALLATSDLALLADPKPGRLLTCAAKPTDAAHARCRAMFERFAKTGWRAEVESGVTIRKSIAEIAGRPLNVPPECDAFAQNNAGMIRCDGVPVLSWMIVADDVQREATQSKFAHMIQEHAGGRLDDDRVPCALEGMKTECRRLGMKDGSLYIGSATVRGSIVVAMCLIKGPGGLPKACAESFQVPLRE